MADETIIANVETRVADAVEAVKAPVEAAVEKVEKAAAKPVRKVRAAVAKRRAKKATAKVAAAVKTINKRAAKSAARVRTATVKAAQDQTERTTTMAYDFTKLFAGYEMPGSDRFQNLFSDASEKGQAFAAKSQKTAEELSELAKANVEALTEAGRIAASGVKTLGQDMLASGRDSFEQASASVKTLADAKSPTEFIQIQSELARASFDRAVSESSKFAEAFVKLAGEAIQPLSTRATLNAERMGELAA